MSSIDDEQGMRRVFTIVKLAPPVQPPEPHAVWFVAGSPFPCPPFKPVEKPGLSAILSRISDAATMMRDLAAFAGIVRPITLPTSFAAEAFPYVVALRAELTLGILEPPVRVAASAIEGQGVFATRDLEPNELVTTYPVHALRVLMDQVPVNKDGLSGFAFFYRDSTLSFNHAEQHWDKYKMHAFCHKASTEKQALCFYGDPNVHPPEECGHMINDPKGTGGGANCAECPIAGGAVTAILVTKPVRAGEELLMRYGSSYWASHQ
jgi:hypothetical protein